MKKKLIEHLTSIVLISLLLLTIVFMITRGRQKQETFKIRELEPFLEQSFISLDDPFHKALLKETLYLYAGRSQASIDSLVTELELYRTESILRAKNTRSRPLQASDLIRVSGMYLKFILAYLITMIITYYAVQSLALIRFIRYRQNRESYVAELITHIRHSEHGRSWRKSMHYYARAAELFIKAVMKGLFSLILFAPAYVIAYSFRTRFDTDTFFFMVILGVISNGLLITYAQKFFTFLITESRKGYVETAIAKNLGNTYSFRKDRGISYGSVFRFKKHFPEHVLGHIYRNARYQYLSTIKEQASFLITGLIIIEMALNIQGHLCYELLQNILYRNYALVIIILLGIFYLVKATEICVDWIIHRSELKYGNRI